MLYDKIVAAREACASAEGRELVRAKQRLDSLVSELHALNLPLAVRLAKRSGARQMKYSSGQEEIIDVASLGLAEAIASWDPSRGSLSNWAWRLINKRVLAEVASTEHGLNPNQYTARWHVTRARADLLRELGHEPTNEQVAERCHLTLQTVTFILRHEASGTPVRLDAPTNLGDGQGSSRGDTLELPEAPRSLPEIPIADMAAATAHLPIGDVWAGLRYWGLDGAEAQHAHLIAASMGRSRETVRLGAKKVAAALAEHVNR